MGLLDIITNPETINYLLRSKIRPYHPLRFWENHIVIKEYNDTIDNNPYKAVIFEPQKIALTESVCDTISFDFSGCYMASFKFGAARMVAHIAKDGNPYNALLTWKDMINKGGIRNIRVFDPADAIFGRCSTQREYTRRFTNGESVWGVITKDEKCYAINVKENIVSTDYTKSTVQLLSIKEVCTVEGRDITTIP